MTLLDTAGKDRLVALLLLGIMFNAGRLFLCRGQEAKHWAGNETSDHSQGQEIGLYFSANADSLPEPQVIMWALQSEAVL